jgi:hypothetical protein
LAGPRAGCAIGGVVRGGNFGSGAGAGPFSVNGRFEPSDSDSDLGFRCAR